MRYTLLNFNEFRDAAHGASVAAGWWHTSERYHPEMIRDPMPDPDRLTIPTKLCLVHSEISEMYDGYMSGEPDGHLPHYLNAPVEAGDIQIRIADLTGYLKIDMTSAIALVLQADHITLDSTVFIGTTKVNTVFSIHEVFMRLNSWTSAAMESYRKGNTPDKIIPALSGVAANLARVVILVDLIARKNDWAIEEITEAKMVYNAERLDHKAEVRNTVGGKAF